MNEFLDPDSTAIKPKPGIAEAVPTVLPIVPTGPKPAPWEQQPKESTKAFAAFLAYLAMGDKRAIRGVSQKLRKNQTLIAKWSKRFGWVERVAAWAAHLAAVEAELLEIRAREKAVDWVKRQTEIKEAEWDVHLKCLEASREGLKRFMERGRNATLADVARLLEVASKLGRLSSGLATERTEVTGEDGGPIRVELSAALDKVYGEPIDVTATEVNNGQD